MEQPTWEKKKGKGWIQRFFYEKKKKKIPSEVRLPALRG